ncbi:DNA/RNA non-specific endonuclease [Saccharibacter sp. 17.LH.SD]|uniref:DNA/RNA non-specific endonuclease n=1 Tax=Saccharibacter sp. 17.LH.SD TaxID=2689393 RepID=UPI00136AE20A|nr:DNA/RNA non-specific endonuclease [Saccharibacter sp. 17.LH.SD]MXV43929.1 DNA/RNA non-specific endonuclease [Saccharibacter sp. 17.LH.SD]
MTRLLILCAFFWSDAAMADCPQFFVGGQPPQAGQLLCNAGYAVGYSTIYKAPLWAAEHLTDESVPKALALHGRTTFSIDYRLPEEGQTGKVDFHDTIYARGHQAPSGDMPDWPTRIQTYFYSNVVAQDEQMNSGPWNQIEQDTRQAAINDGEIYVVTGPVFPAIPQRIGPDRMAVPMAMFKLVYDALDGGTAAIICQNNTPAHCRQLTPEALEATIGFDPMPGLSGHEKTIPLMIKGWSKVIRRSQY